MKHFIVYSHGFGVDRTDRGLLADISASMPGYEHILFDYNDINPENNELTVNPFQEQVRRLNAILSTLDDGEEKVIDIVAHSQGSVVAALANLENVRRVICLAPPDNLSVERIAERFRNAPGSEINLDGISRIARRDGSTTIVPKVYWESVRPLNAIQLYNNLAQRVKTIFIIANEDDVLGITHFDNTTESIDLEQISGDHNFNGEARPGLLKRVSELLN